MRNPERGVTGFLVFANGLFFQHVEGPAAALDTLLDDLSRDPRHHSLEVLGRRPRETRAFPGWKMKRLHMPDSTILAKDLVRNLREMEFPADVLREVSEYLSVRPI